MSEEICGKYMIKFLAYNIPTVEIVTDEDDRK